MKKYKNRRLYNTEDSAYINREELLDLIREGRDVQVQDASSGENVTIETLLQVLISESEEVINLIPSELLHFLIRAQPTAARDFFHSLQPYLQALFHQSGPSPMGFPSFGGNPFPNMFPGFQFPGVSPGTMGVQNPSSQPGENDLEDLKQRLKNLESELAKSKGRKK